MGLCSGLPNLGSPRRWLRLRFHIRAEHRVHAGLIAPALAFEPVHHIPVELGIDRHLEGRDANRGVGPMALVRSRIVFVLGGDPFNLRAGHGPQTLPVGPVLSGCVELGARHRFSLRLATHAEIKWYLPVRSVNVMFRTSPWCLPSILYLGSS